MLRKLGGDGRKIEIDYSILWEREFCLPQSILHSVEGTKQQRVEKQGNIWRLAACVCVCVCSEVGGIWLRPRSHNSFVKSCVL